MGDCYNLHFDPLLGAGTAQSVKRLAMGWTTERLEFESRKGQEFSFLRSVQPGSGVHQTSYTMGTGGSFPGVNRPGREADHLLRLVPRSRKCESMRPLPHTSSRRSA
jgi:hypothetical protein